MSIYTIYASSNDHGVSCTSATYATARAGSGTKTDEVGTTFSTVGQDKISSNYICYQISINFDTSAVPVGTPANITLTLGARAIAGSGDQINAGLRTLGGGTGDFVAGASLSGLSSFGSIATPAVGLNVMTGPADVSRSATFGIILWGKNQQDNVAPTAGASVQVYLSENSGTSSDPKLVIKFNEILTASTGTFVLSGVPAGLSYGRSMIAAAGSFILTGIAAAMGVKRLPPQKRTIQFDTSKLEGSRTLEL